MIDRHSLFFVHGLLLSGLGALMLLPVLAATLTGSGDGGAFLMSAAVTVAAGGFLVAAGQGRRLSLSRKAGFLLTVTAWLNAALFAALPFYFLKRPEHMGYVNCLFEAVSGITTTGSTVLTHLDDLPAGLLLWRGLLNWLGGIGTIGAAFVLMPFLQIGGMQLYRTAAASGMPSPQSAGRTALAIVIAYCVLSVLCAVLFWLEGMSALDALVHAMATVSTGGFSTHDSSLGFFSSAAIQWTAAAFMIVSSAPFLLYVRMGQGEFLALARDPQVRALVVIVLVAALAQLGALLLAGAPATPSLVRAVLVNITSVATSTGFATTDWTGWGALTSMIFLMLTLIGGCTGSPAGGLKIMRVQIMAQLALRQLRRLLHPRAVIPLRYGSQPMAPEVVVSVTVFVFVYFGVLFVLAFGLALTGLDALTSLSGAAAALGNVTHGLGPMIGPASSYDGLPSSAKVLLMAGMLMGRLELFTVIILFTPRYWRS